MFEKSQWIWYTEQIKSDSYGEFYGKFTYYQGKIKCNISCDSDYALYINGKLAYINQYGDFEHYKIYDNLDLSSFVKNGDNHFAVVVWYIGVETQRYKNATPGIIFEVLNESEILLASDSQIATRESKAYRNNICKWITPQLGLSFLYDSSNEDEWKIGQNDGFSYAFHIAKHCNMFLRPNSKLILDDLCSVESINNCLDKDYIVDLGKECFGYPCLRLYSRKKQKLTIIWGEHIVKQHVPRFIGARDFSFEYVAKPGYNEFVSPFLKIGLRYLEVIGENEFVLNYAGCISVTYPVENSNYSFLKEKDKLIYEICLRTLKLCMAEHYMDCPWREQALYVFDARNQMLSGYYAFQNGNFVYAKSNLLLISKDKREDGLLSICFPSGTDLTIPSFSLYYFLAIKEYVQYSKDNTIIGEIIDKLESIIKVFISRTKKGVVLSFSKKNQWNFYDWSEALCGNLGKCDTQEPNLILNCLFYMALQCFEEISEKGGYAFHYANVLKNLKKRIQEIFFDSKSGLFFLSPSKRVFTELGNALCVLLDIVPHYGIKQICQKLTSGEMVQCTLSMRCFKYDALLKSDKNKYAGYIINEIRRDYGMMLNSGATTVWETLEGADAFDGAGSLCHGWSTIPIYYYHILLGNEKQ
jgi:alpha-L-rhamnosidase